MLRQELRLSFSPLANVQTLLGLVPVALEDWQKYSGQGAATLTSAFLIDATISIATSKAFQIGGALLGSTLTPVLGPIGPVAGYVVGGVVASYVSEWIRQTPLHEQAVRAGAEGLKLMEDVVLRAAHWVTSPITGPVY